MRCHSYYDGCERRLRISGCGTLHDELSDFSDGLLHEKRWVAVLRKERRNDTGVAEASSRGARYNNAAPHSAFVRFEMTVVSQLLTASRGVIIAGELGRYSDTLDYIILIGTT